MKLLVDHPHAQPSTAAILLAHGAGAPMDSEFMNKLTASLNARGLSVFRFEFPYMEERRLIGGKKRPPDRQSILVDSWELAFHSVVKEWEKDLPLMVGGKSMGGRIASMVADDIGAAGVCCYGYPFHPPGRADKLRTAHLALSRTPVLILQGTRDPFGRPSELSNLPLGGKVSIHWLKDGDHDFKPRKRSEFTWDSLVEEAALRTAYFAKGC